MTFLSPTGSMTAMSSAAGEPVRDPHLEPVFASRDAAAGVAAFRDRRDPVWRDQ
jgi:hypothetical protein